MKVATQRYTELEKRYQQLNETHQALQAEHKEMEAKFKKMVATASGDSAKLVARVTKMIFY